MNFFGLKNVCFFADFVTVFCYVFCPTVLRNETFLIEKKCIFVQILASLLGICFVKFSLGADTTIFNKPRFYLGKTDVLSNVPIPIATSNITTPIAGATLFVRTTTSEIERFFDRFLDHFDTLERHCSSERRRRRSDVF